MTKYEKRKKDINTYGYINKRGKRVVVRSHRRTYEYRVGVPIANFNARMMFEEKGKKNDLKKTADVTFYNPTEEWAENMDIMDARKIDTYEPKKFKGYTQKETDIMKSLFFDTIPKIDTTDIRTLNDLRSKGMIDKNDKMTGKLLAFFANKIDDVMLDIIENSDKISEDSYSRKFYFDYSSAYKYFSKNEFNSDDYEKVVKLLRGRDEIQKWNDSRQGSDENITGTLYAINTDNDRFRNRFFNRINVDQLLYFSKDLGQNFDPKGLNKEIIRTMIRDTDKHDNEILYKYRQFLDKQRLVEDLSVLQKALLYDVSRRQRIDTETIMKIHNKEDVQELMKRNLITKSVEEENNEFYRLNLGYSAPLGWHANDTKNILDSVKFKRETANLNTKEVVLDKKYVQFPQILTSDREYSIGIDFEKGKDQLESVVAIKGAPAFTFKIDGYDMFGHTHPDRFTAEPSPADLYALVYGQPEFISAVWGTGDFKRMDSVIMWIEDYKKYSDFVRTSSEDSYYKFIDDNNLHGHGVDDKYSNMIYDFTGIRLKHFEDGMKIKIPANPTDYSIRKPVVWSDQQKKKIQEAVEKEEKEKKLQEIQFRYKGKQKMKKKVVKKHA